MKLRAYQEMCVTNTFAAWDLGYQRVAFTVATGGGKTPTLVKIAERHLAETGGPIVVLAHRRELIKQAAKHLRASGPGLRVEVVLGSPGRVGSTKRARNLHNWRRADILVSTVQTLGSAATLRDFPNPTLVIVDEAHRSMAGQYVKVLTALGCFSGTRLLGVTATAFREDHRQFDDVYETVVANVGIEWLISNNDSGPCAPGEGYLIPPTLEHLTVDGLDLSNVPMSRLGGTLDFKDADLAQAMEDSGAFDIIIDTIVSQFPNRKGAIFAPTVESSKYLAQRMTERGLGCHHVDGTTPTGQREKLTKEFGDNKVRWMSNVNIFTEGFDMPDIDMVVLAKPTRSRIFFRQAIGRGLRPAPGKRDCIVLDVCGASDGMSLAGVEALTDSDVAVPETGESLTQLLERSDRERRGRYDRLKSHADKSQEIQDRSERAAEQMRLTSEAMRDKLPGIESFTESLPTRVGKVLDHTTAAIDRFLATTPLMTLTELEEAENFVASNNALAVSALGEVEDIRTGMRIALQATKEAPEGEVARAMVTGHIGTVRGNLFGPEADRYLPPPPGDPSELKTRNAKSSKPTFDRREGWALSTPEGVTYVPIHSDPSMKGPSAMAISVPLGPEFFTARWDLKSGEVDEEYLCTTATDAYNRIVNQACSESSALNLVDPQAAWRRKPSASGSKARELAMRVSGDVEIPDNATAGYVADVITDGIYCKKVDKLARWILEQKGVANNTSSMVG